MQYNEKLYIVQDVSSVEDVISKLKKQAKKDRSSSMDRDGDLGLPPSCAVLFNGSELGEKDILQTKGVQEGSTVFVLKKGSNVSKKDLLAIIVQGVSDVWYKEYKEVMKQRGLDIEFPEFADKWKGLVDSDANEVANELRTTLDRLYLSLRVTWENPNFRQKLSFDQNPSELEAYRKVIVQHMSKAILHDMPLPLRRTIQNAEVWQHQMTQLAKDLLRVGDTILDGLLQILLDTLERNSHNPNNASRLPFRDRTEYKPLGNKHNSHRPNSPFGVGQQYQQRQDNNFVVDPEYAESLLTELSDSDSEDENGDDEK